MKEIIKKKITNYFVGFTNRHFPMLFMWELELPSWSWYSKRFNFRIK